MKFHMKLMSFCFNPIVVRLVGARCVQYVGSFFSWRSFNPIVVRLAGARIVRFNDLVFTESGFNPIVVRLVGARRGTLVRPFWALLEGFNPIVVRLVGARGFWEKDVVMTVQVSIPSWFDWSARAIFTLEGGCLCFSFNPIVVRLVGASTAGNLARRLRTKKFQSHRGSIGRREHGKETWIKLHNNRFNPIVVRLVGARRSWSAQFGSEMRVSIPSWFDWSARGEGALIFGKPRNWFQSHRGSIGRRETSSSPSVRTC